MASKLRIAVWYNLPSGGGKRQVHDHVRGLKARGHEIVAWRPPIPQQDYLPISEIVEEREVSLDLATIPDRTYLDRLRSTLRYEAQLRDAMRRHSETVAKEIDAGDFDVVFANTCRHYLSPWLGRFLETPHLLYLGEPRRAFYEASPRLPWLALPDPRPNDLKGRLKWTSRQIRDELDVHAHRRQAADELDNARSYDRILVNSNYSRESILRAYGLPTSVCYLGVDTGRLEDRELPREPFVISVGAFFEEKNPEFIVRAVGAIPHDRPRLVWVANMVRESCLTRVRAVAEELGVELELRQYIPDAELQDLLNRASVFAYAPKLEPFGYVPLEANACGLPAVVVSEGGVKESVRDGVNGVVVAPTPEAMGAAIAELLADPVGTRELGRRAAAHVREVWNLDRATDELERHLRQVAG